MYLIDLRAHSWPAWNISASYSMVRAEQIEQMHRMIRAAADPRHADWREHGAAERQRNRQAVRTDGTGDLRKDIAGRLRDLWPCRRAAGGGAMSPCAGITWLLIAADSRNRPTQVAGPRTEGDRSSQPIRPALRRAPRRLRGLVLLCQHTYAPCDRARS